MRRISFLLLALISLACVAPAATRPRYGGTLRVAMQSMPTTFDLPAYSSPGDYWDMSHALSLVGDTLVRIDPQSRPQPALAVAWQSDSGARHWQFTLHHGVRFHDGTAASPAAVAQILGALHPDWTVHATAPDSLMIDTEASTPSLLAELALPRNLILTRNAAGIAIGTGPFRVADFQPGRFLKLAASEDCWSGRPFVGNVEIEFGQSLRDQSVALELGRADIIQAANTSARIRASSSLPVELMVLVFSSDSKAQDPRLRQALALAIDRKPIQSVVLKGAAEPAASILPNWMTGYSSVFSTQADVQRAKALLTDSRPSLTLSYDPRDAAQLIAERISLNAREAGIILSVSLSGTADVRLARIALPSPNPAVSLREAARQLALPQPTPHGATVEDLYQAERSLLDGTSVIPLFHLPLAYVAGSRARGWVPDQLGRWNLSDVWLEDSQ